MESVPAPGSGPVVLSIMNTMEGYTDLGPNNATYHRLLEAYKFAYAHREQLGDPGFDGKEIDEATRIMIRWVGLWYSVLGKNLKACLLL